MSTARAFRFARSQSQTVVGAVESIVASKVASALNRIFVMPIFGMASEGPGEAVGGDTGCDTAP